jgi:acyl carrier protein|tara:strand:- start:746 stop:976 length:231 start_codon:yes stop_codon:yes gene_type:complete
MNETVLNTLKGHFGRDKEILPETNMLNDLGADDLDVVDIFMQIEEALGITIPEEETFDVQTVQQVLDLVEKHNVED